jgi:hypothetical protein
MRGVLLLVVLAFPIRACAETIGKAEFQALLQNFITREYGKGFRHLGDERDFDHGHVLSGADGRPVGVLWHTQELALYEPRGGEFGYLDPEARNWLTWLADGRVENARAYRRRSYPSRADWDWFRAAELPALERNHTILDKMLDPELVPVDPSKTVQIVFTRMDCGRAALTPDSADLRVVLPTQEPVCLSLSR